MLVRDVLNADVICCGPDTTAAEAANLMREHHVGDVVVLAIGPPRTPIGVVTDRDLAVEVMAKGIDPGGIQVRRFMRTPVVMAHDSEELEAVIERMRVNAVRRMPVVDHEKLVGIVTMTDLLSALHVGISNVLSISDKAVRAERRLRR
ncbi:MAG TPA: CBS domain-containing protein [Steroidobacteraceae bacterium]|jgi:CBS domain-containing protein|nr:CBS domain-containing protein [Steroidobacteraceae bacterium]